MSQSKVGELVRDLRKAFPSSMVAIGTGVCVMPDGEIKYSWLVTYDGKTQQFDGYKAMIQHIKDVLAIVDMDEPVDPNLNFMSQELKKYGVYL